MICVSIAQESRRLVLVDMLNAGRQCDLLEVRLDAFAKAPNVAEILADKPRPVIMSCRRKSDGGLWEGSEEERLALLRQAIVNKVDYAEIELDVADRIPPYPPAKRVISYTNLNETPGNLAEIYAEAQSKKPDVIKLTTLTRTPEEAWPLVQIVAKQEVPTVVVGLSKPSIMLDVLGKKLGAPWTYAALEQGMETYPDQPTIRDLREVYHFDQIDKSTRFIGVTGFGLRERATVAALNAALAHLGLHPRCLPLGVGSMRAFRKVIEVVRLAGAIIDPDHRQAILEIAAEKEHAVQLAQSADLILHKDDGWYACNTTVSSTMSALKAAVEARTPDRPLAGRMVAIVGTNPAARALAGELSLLGCGLIIAGHDLPPVTALAKELGCRGIRLESLYSTPHDVLIVTEENRDRGIPENRLSSVHPGYLRPDMTVLHLTPGLHKSLLVRAAEAHGCAVVGPYELWLDQLRVQARRLTSKDVPREVLASAVPWLREEE